VIKGAGDDGGVPRVQLESGSGDQLKVDTESRGVEVAIEVNSDGTESNKSWNWIGRLDCSSREGSPARASALGRYRRTTHTGTKYKHTHSRTWMSWMFPSFSLLSISNTYLRKAIDENPSPLGLQLSSRTGRPRSTPVRITEYALMSDTTPRWTTNTNNWENTGYRPQCSTYTRETIRHHTHAFVHHAHPSHPILHCIHTTITAGSTAVLVRT